jgi:hypothetical protein
MTLEEYEKVLEEKRKALLALKTEERGGGRQGVAGHAAAFSKEEHW